MDLALGCLVQTELSVDVSRQAHGQASYEREQSHDPTGLLVVEL